MPRDIETIAVDIDDVILAEAAYIIRFSNDHWGHNLQDEDYIEDWASMWGVSDPDELERRIAGLHRPGVQTSYDLIDGAEEVLRWLTNSYRLVILSSRRGSVQQETLDWADRRLPGIFEKSFFTGFWDNGGSDNHLLTKGKMAKEIGAAYLIDDQPKHCIAAAQEGLVGVLFGDYGVSRNIDVPADVVRCKDWAAVKEYFDGIS